VNGLTTWKCTQSHIKCFWQRKCLPFQLGSNDLCVRFSESCVDFIYFCLFNDAVNS
jgi:hypothetical protein